MSRDAIKEAVHKILHAFIVIVMETLYALIYKLGTETKGLA